MYLECPVIAVRSGGPMETVIDGVTGYLCAQVLVLYSFCFMLLCFIQHCVLYNIVFHAVVFYITLCW